MNFIRTHRHGLALALALATVAALLGEAFPLVGGPVIGIVLGLAVNNLWHPGERFRPGIGFAAKDILQWSIIALGIGLNFTQVAETGMQSLEVTLVTVATAFVSAVVLGKLLGVPDKLKILIGVGTAICGGSAIAAVTPILKPDDHETAFSISTIFLFNLVAVLLFPLLGHVLGLSDKGFGLWAGTAINDTSSVVAAGYSFSHLAGEYATIVKLTRATLIIPVCLAMAAYMAHREHKHGAGDFSLKRIFPWFILWFVVASLLSTFGLIPAVLVPWAHHIAQFLIVVALTAIGLSSNLGQMRGTGVRPILLGLGVWVCVAGSSLMVQHLMGQL
ncbi:YeiH family protein [Jeongeupia chitinilytica]|uniref:Sulfate exporter family transporter n=1 Tax=Jeongeupia chitinilytica TaxID=1041641 RepID=A0ABQ3GYK7_9NEIS|nr:YeiH family protein [Jeongeupia chitinilytica]GHD61538.1 hypothetical protein GCM10007350_16040 [Jeongeupia chitinilytica]